MVALLTLLDQQECMRLREASFDFLFAESRGPPWRKTAINGATVIGMGAVVFAIGSQRSWITSKFQKHEV
jgi:hypothetical protein